MIMQCLLQIIIDLFRYGKPIAYKYIVHSSDSSDEINPFECLHGYSKYGNEIVNRCLIIPQNYQLEGMFNLFYLPMQHFKVFSIPEINITQIKKFVLEK